MILFKRLRKERTDMKWTKPEFKEVTLSMEVTAYSNTDAARAAIEGKAAVAREHASAAPRRAAK